MKVTVLGCGSSAGIPMIGCNCAVCTSDNPKNKRSRVSILIEQAGKRLLVDTSPDLYQQAIRENIRTVDAILMTHAHADHSHGLDDVRSFNFHANKAIPFYADQATMDELKQRFSYAFQPPKPEYGWFRPALEPYVISPNDQESIEISSNFNIQTFVQYHGSHSQTTGIRVGNFAYSTDVNNLPENSMQILENLDVWLVDCLRYNSAPTHAHVELTLSWIERLKPKRAILTHMGHELDYDTLNAETPDNVEPAYDGMVVEI